ncbi:MAG: RIP metalloprotease RseP [Lachnospiraceae bacterium]|nr:RIP metalloprotease RseP [Lachnospiraceae bacterium]
MSIIFAIIIFSLIILFHELGHFLVAKKCDVKVNEFCLGLGPTILHFQKGETTYSLKLLPFGGACMMEGEDEESSDGRAFNNKSVWQRFAIVAAGPIFNFIMAFVLSVILIGAIGYDAPVITGVMEGYSAEEQGMQAGDTIVSLNHYKVHFYQEVSVYSFFHPGETMEVTYLRDGEKHSATITPKYNEEDGRYLLGITGNYAREKGSVIETLCYGFYEMKYQIYTTFQSLKMLFTGQLSVNDMSGPVGIVKTIGDTYDASVTSGAFAVLMNMLNIAVLLSANLGVMNLLPFPALDGGRLVFYVIEAIRGKRINEEIEGRVHLIGFALLMVLMVVIMFNDIHKLFL